MTYKEFENQVVNTFNRMHIVNTCDYGFIEAGVEYDVGSILSKAMRDIFHIKGHSVSREALRNLYRDDLDGVLIEALYSFNSIMNKYHVVFNNSPAYEHCRLHIV